MNDNLSHADETRRDALRAKIEASERRIEQRTLAKRAREAADAATGYAREHPLTVLAGAVLIGLLIGAMTRPGRRAVGRIASGAAASVGGAAGAFGSAASDVGSAATGRVARIGTTLADAIVAYAAGLLEEVIATARAGQDRIEDLSDESGTRVRRIKRDAAHFTAAAADDTRALARRTRRKAARAVRDLSARAKA